jgi:hypothetical protein
MKRKLSDKLKFISTNTHLRFVVLCSLLLFALFFAFPEFFSSAETYKKGVKKESAMGNFVNKIFSTGEEKEEKFDPLVYDAKMLELANNPPPKPPTTKVVKDPKTGLESTVTVEPKPVVYPWPVKTVYPKPGALLPYNRIIAYYGNLYSRKMGVLGEYDEEIMLSKLEVEVKKWEAADPTTPVVPALHYIAVVAQGSAGADSKYRARMPDSEIDKLLKIAEKINAIVFLDVQVGFSTLEDELPRLEKYLKLPNVHLGIDAEFSMKTGIRPGKVVGTFDAKDINFAANYLAKVVKENNLPPKVLVVHRYTQKMITNYKNITPLPEVQIVMHMDGWGGAAKKIGTYRNFIYSEPVQFTGFKLFYKNDILTPGTTLMTPQDLLKLNPRPIYIQYQ